MCTITAYLLNIQAEFLKLSQTEELQNVVFIPNWLQILTGVHNICFILFTWGDLTYMSGEKGDVNLSDISRFSSTFLHDRFKNSLNLSQLRRFSEQWDILINLLHLGGLTATFQILDHLPYIGRFTQICRHVYWSLLRVQKNVTKQTLLPLKILKFLFLKHKDRLVATFLPDRSCSLGIWNKKIGNIGHKNYLGLSCTFRRPNKVPVSD